MKLDTVVEAKLIEKVDKVRQETKDLIDPVGVEIDKNVGAKINQEVEEVKLMLDDVREAMEIEKRKNNVVIFGDKEDDL